MFPRFFGLLLWLVAFALHGQEPTRPGPVTDSEFVLQNGGALVIIKDARGAGSGFVARQNGKVYLFTNAHVLAASRRAAFTLLDGTQLTPVAFELAVGHDLVRLSLQKPPPQFLETATDLSHTIRLEDDVFVPGNSGGGGVVTSLRGKLRGIGPDRIEVDSPFIPGNSGSPIIHAPTGQVIGIATYLTRRPDEFGSSPGGGRRPGGGNIVTRRFGYRLDSVKTWQPINPAGFEAESVQFDKIEELTKDLVKFLDAMHANRTPDPATQTLRGPVTAWRQTMAKKGVSEYDRRNAVESLLSSLRYLSRSDITAAEQTMRYDYFRRGLTEQKQVRDQLYEVFNKEAQSFSAPSLR